MAPPRPRQSTVERRRALFEEAREVVEREYRGDLALDELARRVAASRRQLQRAFAEAGGTSFRSYLLTTRMRRGADLLRSSSLPVAEVASAVGYRDAAQFAKAFGRHHGTSPSTYRAAARRSPA